MQHHGQPALGFNFLVISGDMCYGKFQVEGFCESYLNGVSQHNARDTYFPVINFAGLINQFLDSHEVLGCCLGGRNNKVNNSCQE